MGFNRRTPKFDKEANNKPPSDMYAYNLGYRGGMYTYDDYRPELSDGRIGVQYIQGLLHDLNSNDFVIKKGRWSWTIFILIIPFIATITACIIIGTNMKSSSSEFDHNQRLIEIYKSGYINSQAGVICIILCVILGISSLVGTFLVAAKEGYKYNTVREGFLDIIINKHQQEVFSHLDCTLKMSPYTAYVIIEFDWRHRHQAVGQVVPFSNPSQGHFNQVYPKGTSVMAI